MGNQLARSSLDALSIWKTGRLIALFFLVCNIETAQAQQITLQQPALHNFSVGTSVSVPDRGRTVLGGVSRAGSSRSTYGPFRSGTNSGVFGQGSNVAAHVTIHDFDEMDRRALSTTAPARSRDVSVKLSPNAEHAYQVLHSRRR